MFHEVHFHLLEGSPEVRVALNLLSNQLKWLYAEGENAKFPLKRTTKRICTFSRASPGSVRCSFCSKTKLKLLHDRFNWCQGKPYWCHSKAHARITFGANSNIFRKIIYVNRKFIYVKNASWAIKFMSEIWYWSHSKAHGRITFGTNSNIFQKIIYVRIHEVNENNFWEISKCWNLLGYRSPEILQFWWYKHHFWFPDASCDADSVYSKNNAFDWEMRNLRWGLGGG